MVLLQTGVPIFVPIIVFVVGLVIAVSAVVRNRVRVHDDRSAKREASELLASATAHDLAAANQPTPLAMTLPPPLTEEEWLARRVHLETGRKSATERLRSARKHWESLVGPDADPHDVEDLLRVRDPQLELVGAASKNVPDGAYGQRRAPEDVGAVACRVGRQSATTSLPNRTPSTPISSDSEPPVVSVRPRPGNGCRRRGVERRVCHDRPADRADRAGAVAGRRRTRGDARNTACRRRSAHRGTAGPRRRGHGRRLRGRRRSRLSPDGYEKLWPQPQVRCALGLLMAKPACCNPSL